MLGPIIKTSALSIENKVYGKYMLVSCLIVLLCAYIQYTFLLNLSMHWIDLVIPSVVGCFFGLLIARIHVLHSQLVEAAHDPLTNLWGRRHFNEILKQEVEASNRYGQELSLIIFDIDDFKLVNDGHGHNAGDVILRELAAVLRQNQRGSDVYARWGGEEFLVLMPGTGLSAALVTAERLRKAIEEAPFSYVNRVTSSFGVTEYNSKSNKNAEHEPFNTMINRADRALYQAKQQGKNCVASA